VGIGRGWGEGEMDGGCNRNMTEWLPKVSIDVALEVRYSKNAPSLAHLK